MDTQNQHFKLRLGLFVAGGLTLFVLAVFIIGKQKNMFSPVFRLTTVFYNVSGLQIGNNVRFSGINIGVVDDIRIINDSTVKVDMVIRKDVQKFIKTDCKVSIGSEGLIGDKLLIISQGSFNAPLARKDDYLESIEPIETEAIISSIYVTSANVEVISDQLAEIMIKINSGNGTLGRLIQDSTIADNLYQTMVNLKLGTKGLEENMTAAKHNFLLRGYFQKKAREEAQKKKKEDEAQKKRDKALKDNK